MVGIALGVSVMLLSVFIIAGFKGEIVSKLTGFSSHLNIVAVGSHSAYETPSGVCGADSLRAETASQPGVVAAWPYVVRPAILRSPQQIHGVVLYGVDTLYSSEFIRGHIVEGAYPDFATPAASDGVLVSATVASLLQVKTGDKLQAHFVQNPPRVRVFKVVGIYDTGLADYDNAYVFCDMRHLQRLNGWADDEVTGVAVDLADLTQIPEAEERLYDILPWDERGNRCKVTTIYEAAPNLFDWLDTLDTNVWIILTLIVLVAGFNMVSGLLILILEKTTLIGVMKAMGCDGVRLRRLFLCMAVGLVGRGMLWGNGIAFVLAGIQYFFHVIPLDPVAYYMDTVPIAFRLSDVLLLDVGVMVVSALMMMVPTMLISSIRPIKAIRFE